jgi:hypothetical protein
MRGQWEKEWNPKKAPRRGAIQVPKEIGGNIKMRNIVKVSLKCPGHLLLCVLLIFIVVSFASTAGALPLTTGINISGMINGEVIAGTGISITDIDTGVSQTTIVFTSIPNGFDVIAYGKSHKTKHHPKKAMEIAGAVNLDTLSPAGYDFTTTMTYENGDTIVSSGQVRADPHDPHTDFYSLVLQGSYTGPTNAVDILPATATLSSIASGKVSMADKETIVLSDGGTITLKEVGTFTLLNSDAVLPFDELLHVTVDHVSFDPDTMTLQLNTTAQISPAPEVPAITPLSFLLALLSLFGLGAIAMRKMYRR